ncbi:MAG: hypothetical protein ACRBDL_04750 [Alphaproteobacteria bacterium]
MPSEIGNPPPKNTILKLKLSSPPQAVSKPDTTVKSTQTPVHTTQQPKEVVAQSLNTHANKLNTLLDGISHSAQTLEHAQKQISDIKDTLTNLQDVLNDENASPSSHEKHYREAINHINDVASTSSLNTNLLNGGFLTTTLSDETQSTIKTSGAYLNAQGLDLPESLNDIPQAHNDIQNALQHIYNFRTQINNDLTIITDQKSFTQSTINTIENGVKTLDKTDRSEESANLIALQTRQILSHSGNVPLAARSQQSVLRLF